jgi:hypothetical protein
LCNRLMKQESTIGSAGYICFKYLDFLQPRGGLSIEETI